MRNAVRVPATDRRLALAEATLRFRILGSLKVERAGEPIALGGPQQRAMLAHLVRLQGHC